MLVVLLLQALGLESNSLSKPVGELVRLFCLPYSVRLNKFELFIPQGLSKDPE